MKHTILHYVIEFKDQEGCPKATNLGRKGTWSYSGEALLRSQRKRHRVQAGGQGGHGNVRQTVARLPKLQLEPRETDVPSCSRLFQFQP